MKIIIAGASGFVGSALVSFLQKAGHDISRLVRHPETSVNEIRWDPYQNKLPLDKLEGADAVINLCGENLASCRWTEKKKEAILNSRVQTTQVIAQGLQHLENPPSVYINASAIGYYGYHTPDHTTEKGENGEGFLAKVCREWEAATEPAASLPTRLIRLRIGVVLGRNGGILKRITPPINLGLGGVIGSGEQMFSWVAIDDLVRIFLHCLATESLRGPVNAVSPHPVTNLEFTKILGKTLHRPTFIPLPATLAHLIFGEMADETMLSTCSIYPEKLLQTGYTFEYPDLQSACNHFFH